MTPPPASDRSHLVRVVAVLAAAAALCWPVVINRGAFLHPDSIGYVRGPDVAVMKLAGERFGTAWAKVDPGSVDQRHAAAPKGARTASYNDNEVLAGRSIYYGFLAYLGALTGGFWLTVFVQALAVAWLAEIVLRALRITSLAAYAGVMAVLALASPAAFFASFLMPDIWAGVAIGAVAAAFALSGRLGPLDVAALGAMSLFAALAHNSVIPIILSLMIVGGAYALWRRASAPAPWLGYGLCIVALAGAAAGSEAFNLMVQRTAGLPPLMPPFLSARVIADGPGTRFARERCRDEFVVCRYADRFPMQVDDFLWADGRAGVFETASMADRRALGTEQADFAVAVVRAYPLEQALASARNAAAQVFDTELSDFNYKPSVAGSLTSRAPPAYAQVLRRTVAYREGWPLEGLWQVQSMAALAALSAMVGAAPRARRARAGSDAAAAAHFAGLALAGVLANAVVCGVLSTLWGRYEARVVWVVPLAAAALLMAAWPQRLRLAAQAGRTFTSPKSGAPIGSPNGVSGHAW
jgi:hypothetical protein